MKIVCFLLATVSLFLQAAIMPINSIEEAHPHFSEINHATLVFFDLDCTLVQNGEPAFQMANLKKHKPIVKKLLASLSEEQEHLFWNTSTLGSPTILIDPTSLELFSQLHKAGISTIGLTAQKIGPLFEVPNMEQWRIDRLQALGFDFTVTAPVVTNFSFPGANYQGGILFSDEQGKGEVLVAFLRAADLHPAKIIFMDDREENVNDVEAALQQFDPEIAFVGLHYRGALHYPSADITAAEFAEKWTAVANRIR